MQALQAALYFDNLFMQRSNPQPVTFLGVSPVKMELILKCMYTGEVATGLENAKQLLNTAKAPMVYGYCNEMDSGHRQVFGDMEYNLNRFNTFQTETVRIPRVVLISYRSDMWDCFDFSFFSQMWNDTMEKIRQNYYVTQPNVCRYVDVNNNNDDPYPLFEKEMPSAMMSVHTKNDFELKKPSYFNVRPTGFA